jgi:hypothetical protein
LGLFLLPPNTFGAPLLLLMPHVATMGISEAVGSIGRLLHWNCIRATSHSAQRPDEDVDISL